MIAFRTGVISLLLQPELRDLLLASHAPESLGLDEAVRVLQALDAFVADPDAVDNVVAFVEQNLRAGAWRPEARAMLGVARFREHAVEVSRPPKHVLPPIELPTLDDLLEGRIAEGGFERLIREIIRARFGDDLANMNAFRDETAQALGLGAVASDAKDIAGYLNGALPSSYREVLMLALELGFSRDAGGSLYASIETGFAYVWISDMIRKNGWQGSLAPEGVRVGPAFSRAEMLLLTAMLVAGRREVPEIVLPLTGKGVRALVRYASVAVPREELAYETIAAAVMAMEKGESHGLAQQLAEFTFRRETGPAAAVIRGMALASEGAGESGNAAQLHLMAAELLATMGSLARNDRYYRHMMMDSYRKVVAMGQRAADLRRSTLLRPALSKEIIADAAAKLRTLEQEERQASEGVDGEGGGGGGMGGAGHSGNAAPSGGAPSGGVPSGGASLQGRAQGVARTPFSSVGLVDDIVSGPSAAEAMDAVAVEVAVDGAELFLDPSLFASPEPVPTWLENAAITNHMVPGTIR